MAISDRIVLAYWKMDAAAGQPRGNSASSSVGSFEEYGGNVATVAGHIFARAAHWSGVVGDNYLRLPRAGFAELDTAVGAERSRTMAFWINFHDFPPDAGPTGYKYIWRRGGGAWSAGGEQLKTNQERTWGNTWASDNTGTLAHGPPAVEDVWTLIFMLFDAANNEFSITGFWPGVAGEQWGERISSSTGTAATASTVLYATLCEPYWSGSAWNYQDVDLGPVAIWDGLLTAGERAEYYNDGDGINLLDVTVGDVTIDLDPLFSGVVAEPVGIGAYVDAPETSIESGVLAYGDSTTLTLNPSDLPGNFDHLYSSGGYFVAHVTLTAANGDTATDSVALDLITGAGVDAGGPYTGVPSAAVTISGAATLDPVTATAMLDFGDGSSVQALPGSVTTVSHIYAVEGSYAATVQLADSAGNFASDTEALIVFGSWVVSTTAVMRLGAWYLPLPRSSDPYQKEWVPVGSNRRMINGSLRAQVVSGFWRIRPVWEGLSRVERNTLWTAYMSHLTTAGLLILPDATETQVLTSAGSWQERQWWRETTPLYDVTFAMEGV